MSNLSGEERTSRVVPARRPGSIKVVGDRLTAALRDSFPETWNASGQGSDSRVSYRPLGRDSVGALQDGTASVPGRHESQDPPRHRAIAT